MSENTVNEGDAPEEPAEPAPPVSGDGDVGVVPPSEELPDEGEQPPLAPPPSNPDPGPPDENYPPVDQPG